MRIVVFLLGLVGSLLILFAAGLYAKDYEPLSAVRGLLVDTEGALRSAGLTQLEDNIIADQQPARMAILLLMAGIMGLLGAFFVLPGCGWQAALLMLTPVIGLAVVNPAIALIAAGVQALAAILALFVRPTPVVVAREAVVPVLT